MTTVLARADAIRGAHEIRARELELAGGADRLPAGERAEAVDRHVFETARAFDTDDLERRRRVRRVGEEDVLRQELRRWKERDEVLVAAGLELVLVLDR